mgnify:CR=1 FL=1
MKLLFEGWRKYVNEAEEKPFDQGLREQRATDLEIAATIEENKDSPDKLAEEIAKILSAEFHKKKR